MNEPLWKLQDVVMRGSRRARLLDVSVTIRRGATAVVGSSGAGKTSLLNLLTGFERADGGRVLSMLPNLEDRLSLYWVPQNYGLWPHLTAAEHLQVVMQGAADKVDRRVRLLNDFDLTEASERRPARLSQGERARLSTARALASQAAVLVLDEPLAHVDPARSGKYWEVIRNSCRDTGTSLILATHSPETVLANAQQAICLKEGRVLYEGSVDDLYYRPDSPELASYLGPANWLADEEAPAWLDGRLDGTRCYRPEQISLVPAQSSRIVVECSRFAGSVAEVDLLDESAGRRRRFFYRPPRNELSPGQRVEIKVLALLMVCSLLLLTGCEVSLGPQLPVNEVRYWIVPADGRKLPAPRSMTRGPASEIYVLDNSGRILVYNESGALQRQWRMPEYAIGQPEGVCVLPDGRVAVADTHYHRIVYFDTQGELLAMQGEYGTAPVQFIYPVGITSDEDGNYYVCEYGSNDRVQKFAPDDSFLLEFGTFGVDEGEFQRPSGVVWHTGRVYVADAINNRIQVFTDAGEFVEVLHSNHAPADLHYPYDITSNAEGDLFVVEYGAGRVTQLDRSGNVRGRYGTTGRGNGQLSTPWGLTISSSGSVLVADTGNRRIVELRM